MTERHADNCDYHCDQYPWECTCGVSNPKEPDTMSEQTNTPVGGLDNQPTKTIQTVSGPINDDGTIVTSDAPYDPNTTYVMAAEPETILERAEEVIEEAIGAIEEAAEAVAAEAEHLTEEAVTGVKKVWNNGLQAWV